MDKDQVLRRLDAQMGMAAYQPLWLRIARREATEPLSQKMAHWADRLGETRVRPSQDDSGALWPGCLWPATCAPAGVCALTYARVLAIARASESVRMTRDARTRTKYPR